MYNSVIKPVGTDFKGKTVDFHTGEVTEIVVEPASEEEIKETVAVMGGEDWKLWLEALHEANVLANDVMTVAFSYIGPVVTHAIYKDGTIGHGKKDLEKRSEQIDVLLKDISGKSYVSVNKALVTQASAAIPVVPLYIALLFKVMKEKGLHEDCIAQLYRLYDEKMYNGDSVLKDEDGKLRVDDWEMQGDVQDEVAKLWQEANTENINEISDVAGFRNDFFRLFGFERDDVDYEADVDLEEVL
jgi:enoyl-[acyl-carrier protein] reductase/trans-2-enoyl-CoA reductase (NAD+)